MNNITRLVLETSNSIDSFDYSNEDEQCSYEACENPRFRVVEGEANAVYSDTGISIVEGSTEVFRNHMESIGRNMASRIEQEDHSKYEEWSNDMSRFKKEYLESKDRKEKFDPEMIKESIRVGRFKSI